MAPPPAAPARVLVAEDDSSLRRLLEMRLTLDGYRTRTTGDGREALEMLASWCPTWWSATS